MTAAPLVHAGGGYFNGVKGARASGRGGAFTARADDLSAVALNPAGIARLGTTTLQIGNRFSYNSVEFHRAPTLDWGHPDNGVPPYVEFETVHNETPWQLLEPMLGVASNFGLQDWGFALAIYPPAGASKVEFPADGPQRYMMIRRELVILNYTATAAWKYQDLFGVGATLQWIHVPRLTYELIIDATGRESEVRPVWSELDMHATTTGSDPFTFNAILGAWYRPHPNWELGLAGQVIPSEIRTDSTLDIEQVGDIQGELELRRGRERANDVTVTLPLPLTARGGVRYRYLERQRELFDVELDVVYESWSRVERFTLDSNNLVGTLAGDTVPVGVITVEKQWRDNVSVHLGGDYAAIPDLLTARGGVYYEMAVGEPAYANVDIPAAQQLGAALGGSVMFGNSELALAYEYRHQPAVTIREGDARVYQQAPASACEPPYDDPATCHPAYLGQPAPAANAGTHRAHSHMLTIDWLYRF